MQLLNLIESMAMQKVRINRTIEEVQLVTAAIDAFSPASGKKVSGLDYRSYVDVSALEQAVSVIGGGFHGLNSRQDERYSYYMRFGRIPQELLPGSCNSIKRWNWPY